MIKGCQFSKSTCTFCSAIAKIEGNTPCNKTGHDFYGESDGDKVTLEGWTSSKPFHRITFESKAVIERTPYKVDLLSDKLWPNFVTQVFIKEKLLIYSGLTKPVQIFSKSKSITSNPNRITTIVAISLVVTLLVLITIALIIFLFKRRPRNKNGLSSSKTSKSYNHPTPGASIDLDQMAPTLPSSKNKSPTQPSPDNQPNSNVQTIDSVTPQ